MRTLALPPPDIHFAALKVLHRCAYTTRNWTFDDSSISKKQLNDLWEAVHEIPDLLWRWRPDAEAELLLYIREYDQKWQDLRLMATYEQARVEFNAG